MLLLQSHLAVVCANHFQNFKTAFESWVSAHTSYVFSSDILFLFSLLNISKAINLSFMFLQERVSMIEVRNR